MNTSKYSQLFGQYMPMNIANYCILPYLGIHPEEVQKQRNRLIRHVDVSDLEYVNYKSVQETIDDMNLQWAETMSHEFREEHPELYCYNSRWRTPHKQRINPCICVDRWDHKIKENRNELLELEIRKKFYPKLRDYDCDKHDLNYQIDRYKYEQMKEIEFNSKESC